MTNLKLITLVSSLILLVNITTGEKCGDVMCTADYNPQCGTDGITYSNLCTLQAKQCGKPSLQLAHTGECIQSAGPGCGDIVCTADYDPLCGSDGITYSNLCTLQAKQCGIPSLQLAYKGECSQQLNEGGQNCADIIYICTADYDPQCGTDGITYSNLCTLQAKQCGIPSLQLAHTGECIQLAGPGCGDIVCTADYDPQCGSDGITYINPCSLQAKQCGKPSLQLAHTGECGPVDKSGCGSSQCTAHFDPQCGSDGITYNNLCSLHYSQWCDKPSLQLAYKGECTQLNEAIKPGYCPAVTLDQFGICVQDCNTDNDCSGTDKCCRNGCGNTCQSARTSKPGECPPIDEDNIMCVKQTNPCYTDMDCKGVDKCCWTGCSPICMKPAPREGICPNEAYNTVSCDLPSCEGDYDCESPQKCCPACGANKCSTVEAPKPGLCPAVEGGMMGICMEGCTVDSDCGGTEKCCSNGCGHACKSPANNTCKVLDKEYLPGPVPDPDGCNTCFCENGWIGCTKMLCSCNINGETYHMGDSYPQGDGCNTCKCRGDNDNIGMICTDYYCDPQTHHRAGKLKTFTIVSVCVAVIGIIIIVTALSFVLYKMNKARSNKKKTAKVDDYSKSQLVDEPYPVKA